MNIDITAFGVLPTGETDCTQKLQEAIDTCANAGGGRVTLSPGLYPVASLELKDNVTLHIEQGATLQGIYNSEHYRAICPVESRQTALVFARDANNIAIAGGGVIDGQGERYWRKLAGPRSNRPDVEDVGVIQFWYEHIEELRKPNRILAFLRCCNVMVSDVRLTGATAWTFHLIGCLDVKVRGIDIDNPFIGPNTDGIDIDGSSDVLISDCTIHTGDDAIVLKTKNIFKTHTPIRNVTVTNCRFSTNCNGFKIGTETQEDVENICFSNTTIYNPDDAPPVERCISAIAIETVDGGNVRNVVCSNITIINSRTALFIRLGKWLRGAAEDAGCLRGIALNNIIATGATHPSVVSGIPGHPVEDLQLSNIQLETQGGCPLSPDEIGKIPEKEDEYPEIFMFETVPASALYLRHADNVDIRSLFSRLREKDARPPVFAEDVSRLRVDPALLKLGN